MDSASEMLLAVDVHWASEDCPSEVPSDDDPGRVTARWRMPRVARAWRRLNRASRLRAMSLSVGRALLYSIS